MKGILLAAGRGSRMQAYTNELPKCLTPLWGKALLEYQIDAMRRAQITRIAIVRGYQKDKISYEGVTYFENNNWKKSNMVQSLMCAERFFQSEPCIISYTDIAYEANAIAGLREMNADIAVAYIDNWKALWSLRFKDPLSDLESFRLAADNRIIEIGKKAGSMEEIQGQFAGLIRLTPQGLNIIKEFLSEKKEKAMQLDMTSLLQELIINGVSVAASLYDGPWIEMDSIDDKKLYERYGKNYFGFSM